MSSEVGPMFAKFESGFEGKRLKQPDASGMSNHVCTMLCCPQCFGAFAQFKGPLQDLPLIFLVGAVNDKAAPPLGLARPAREQDGEMLELGQGRSQLAPDGRSHLQPDTARRRLPGFDVKSQRSFLAMTVGPKILRTCYNV